MNTQQAISELATMLATDKPDSVRVCDILLTLAASSSELEVRAKDDDRIVLYCNGETFTIRAARATGWFRTVLARIGAIFLKCESGPEKADESEGTHLLVQPTQTRSTLRINRATYAKGPGSPLYRVQGTVSLSLQGTRETSVHVTMENSGVEHWLRMAKE
jgi:hypothetical protein